MAEGVLVLGVGEGTKLLEGYLSGSKAYTAEALLGSETDTLDRTGRQSVFIEILARVDGLVARQCHRNGGRVPYFPGYDSFPPS